MSESFSIGRDPSCDITLADESVSRVHAEVSFTDDGASFVRDCGSVNGTAVMRVGERHPVVAPFWLRDVDTVTFGDVAVDVATLRDMVRAVREARAVPPAPKGVGADRRGVQRAEEGAGQSPLRPEAGPAGAGRPAVDAARPGFAEFLPLVAGFARLRERRLLLPGLGLVLLIVLLMSAQSQKDPIAFLNTVAVAVCLGSLALVYRLCGRHRPLLAILAVMLAEAFIMTRLLTPFAYVFRGLTGAQTLAHSGNVVGAFIGHTISAGMMEELMKMTPSLVLIGCATQLSRTRLRRWPPTEPLDVIVYACAAATMFVMIETLGQYVPGQMARSFKATVAVTGNEQLGALRGILDGSQLAILRTVSGLSGHLAYSGYFAYYIGLGLLRPSQRTRLWLGGYLGASVLHGASNAANSTESLMLVLLVKLTTVSFLLAAILNARKVSPTRSENFATVSLGRIV
jgi:RsiW-degrading membrane proteinase PrsW (M82 family)